jgi:hypothetical protein
MAFLGLSVAPHTNVTKSPLTNTNKLEYLQPQAQYISKVQLVRYDHA